MPHAHAHGRKQQLARSHGVGKHARGECTADAAGQRVSATAGGSEDWLLGARLAVGPALPAGRTDEIVSKLRPTNASLCARNRRSRCAALTCTARKLAPTPAPRLALLGDSAADRRSPSTRRGLAERLPHSRSAGGAAALGTHLREVHAVRRRDLHAALARVRAESSPLLTAGIGLSGIQPKRESA